MATYQNVQSSIGGEMAGTQSWNSTTEAGLGPARARPRLRAARHRPDDAALHAHFARRTAAPDRPRILPRPDRLDPSQLRLRAGLLRAPPLRRPRRRPLRRASCPHRRAARVHRRVPRRTARPGTGDPALRPLRAGRGRRPRRTRGHGRTARGLPPTRRVRTGDGHLGRTLGHRRHSGAPALGGHLGARVLAARPGRPGRGVRPRPRPRAAAPAA